MLLSIIAFENETNTTVGQERKAKFKLRWGTRHHTKPLLLI